MTIHIYLSPHLDDAVFSCGGTIHRQIESGDSVQVVTIFAGTPAGTGFNDLAKWNHTQWGVAGDPAAERRAEDAAALSGLGARYLHLDYLDSMYRLHPVGGEWLYTTSEALFSDVHPSDPMCPLDLAQSICQLIPSPETGCLHAPLAAGHHVDHQLARGAGLALLAHGYQVSFYEDLPHAEKAGAVDAALATLPEGMRDSIIVHLQESDIVAKIEASASYASQLGVQFGGPGQVAPRLRAHATSLGDENGYAERHWLLTLLDTSSPRGENTCFPHDP